MEFLKWSFFGNTLDRWILGIVLALLSLVALQVVMWISRRLLIRKEASENYSRNTLTVVRHILQTIFSGISAAFAVAAVIYALSAPLTLPAKLELALWRIATALVMVQVAVWVVGIIKVCLQDYFAGSERTNGRSALSLGIFILQTAVWSTTALLIVQNFGVNVSALITGLGIGGVAVALAVQNVLSDLFASLSIVLDKPFEIGDAINAGEYNGTVEHIGLKTTRLRSLTGEQIVIPNSDLLQSRVRNYKRMNERRIEFRFGISYNADPDVVETIPAKVKEIIARHTDVRLDRVHFKELGESALVIEAVYIVLTSDYVRYMDIQQQVNLDIMRLISKEGLASAFPSRALFIEKMPEISLKTTSEGREPARDAS